MYSVLSDFVNLIMSKPNHHTITAFLSEHLSPDEQPCAVSFGVVKDDGYLEVVALAGYGDLDLSKVPAIHISQNRPSSIAIRNMKLTLFSKSEIAQFDWWQNKAFVEQWNSVVAIPVGADRVYMALFRSDLTQVDDYLSYLRLVQNLLEIHEGQQVHPKASKASFANAETQLTKRQDLIVGLIKEGKTNMQIALDLGYSESLIRQETITIYRKLGIDGRKSLLDQ